MDNKWKHGRSITKYNPAFRNEKGHYMKDEWIGFGQIGGVYEGVLLTLDSYLQTESKYIKAAYDFFAFHNCENIIIKSLEKYHADDYNLSDKKELLTFFDNIEEGTIIPLNDLTLLIKLILREIAWAELFCISDDEGALTFGYDFYMYFHSNKDMSELYSKVEQLGLYVW